MSLAALVGRRDRGIQCLQPRHDAVGMAVGRPDQRAARTYAGVADDDVAAELGELRDVAVLLVDRFPRSVRRIEQDAGRQLIMGAAGVEYSRRTVLAVAVALSLIMSRRLRHAP